MTFEKLFAEYIKSPRFRKLSPRSKQIYLYCGDRLAKFFGAQNINKIKRSDLLRYQNDYVETPAHGNLALRIASVVFTFGMDMDYVAFNPASRIAKLKIGSHVKWTPDEVKQVVALGDRRISTAVALAWYTGQREGDVLSMRWRDYDGTYISVTQSKTGLEMKIKVHPDLVAYLDSIRGVEDPDHYIVSGKNPMSGQAFRNMLKRRTNKLHIEKVFHGIRKGVASSLAEKRTPISEIAAIMGHKSIRMAAYYAEQAESKILTDNAVDNLVSLAT